VVPVEAERLGARGQRPHLPPVLPVTNERLGLQGSQGSSRAVSSRKVLHQPRRCARLGTGHGSSAEPSPPIPVW
jgi:hypothetical protein